MNEVEKVVFSNTLTELEWENSRLAERDLEDEVRELKGAEGRDVFGDGLPRAGWDLAAATRLASGALGLQYSRKA